MWEKIKHTYNYIISSPKIVSHNVFNFIINKKNALKEFWYREEHYKEMKELGTFEGYLDGKDMKLIYDDNNNDVSYNSKKYALYTKALRNLKAARQNLEEFSVRYFKAEKENLLSTYDIKIKFLEQEMIPKTKAKCNFIPLHVSLTDEEDLYLAIGHEETIWRDYNLEVEKNKALQAQVQLLQNRIIELEHYTKEIQHNTDALCRQLESKVKDLTQRNEKLQSDVKRHLAEEYHTDEKITAKVTAGIAHWKIDAQQKIDTIQAEYKRKVSTLELRNEEMKTESAAAIQQMEATNNILRNRVNDYQQKNELLEKEKSDTAENLRQESEAHIALQQQFNTSKIAHKKTSSEQEDLIKEYERNLKSYKINIQEQRLLLEETQKVNQYMIANNRPQDIIVKLNIELSRTTQALTNFQEIYLSRFASLTSNITSLNATRKDYYDTLTIKETQENQLKTLETDFTLFKEKWDMLQEIPLNPRDLTPYNTEKETFDRRIEKTTQYLAKVKIRLQAYSEDVQKKENELITQFSELNAMQDKMYVHIMKITAHIKDLKALENYFLEESRQVLNRTYTEPDSEKEARLAKMKSFVTKPITKDIFSISAPQSIKPSQTTSTVQSSPVSSIPSSPSSSPLSSAPSSPVVTPEPSPRHNNHMQVSLYPRNLSFQINPSFAEMIPNNNSTNTNTSTSPSVSDIVD